jgi:hypothetical protein
MSRQQHIKEITSRLDDLSYENEVLGECYQANSTFNIHEWRSAKENLEEERALLRQELQAERYFQSIWES